MLAKNLYSTVEITFWDTIIIILGGLRWIIQHKGKLLGFLYQAVAWSSIGLLIGLVAGYLFAQQ